MVSLTRKADGSTRRHRRATSKLVAAIWLAAITLIGAGVGGAVAIMINTTRTIPVDIQEFRPTEGTKVYSSDGVLLGTASEENREVVKLKDVPEHLRNAVVAIEDSRFYAHAGVDLRGIARAILRNLRGGRVAEGGSTITQQLARNIYLTQRRTVSRKLQEIALAIRIERNYSKDQILWMYLNQVYFGSRAYGVQAASKVYFGKDVKDLTLSQCALLAGLPRRPSVYSPYENPDLARERRNVVLVRMAELGYVSREQAEQARIAPIRLAGIQNEARGFRAPYFTSYVLGQLADQYGEDVVHRAGFKVTATLNYELQKVAERALINGVEAAKRLRVSQGALVCLEPKTGYIRAMVGGVDFKSSQFNRAVQAKRQPGSSFKIFVYTAAVANGVRPTDRFSARPVTYRGANGKDWTPRDERSYYGMVSVKRAVAKSINPVAVKVADKIGVAEVIKYAKLMGITSPLDPYLSLALGSSVVSPLEMASACSVLANNGHRVPPTGILRVEDAEGVVIEETDPVPERVLSEGVVKVMDDLLRGVVTSGTGWRAKAVPDARGKTGTTDRNRDAWFVGYTPDLVAAVWVGNDNYSPMRRVAGGTVGVPIWTSFMLKALPIYHRMQAASQPTDVETRPDVRIEHPSGGRDEARPPSPAVQERSGPDSVTRTICSDSLFLATRACPRKHSETYVPGFEPTEYCPMHKASRRARPPSTEPAEAESQPVEETPPPQSVVRVTICGDTGLIANKYCPHKAVRTYNEGEQPTEVCSAHRSMYTYY